MMFIDACAEDAAFPELDARELANRPFERGQHVVGFATRPGKVAKNGSPDPSCAGHAPYTCQLLRHLRTPGMEVSDVMKQVHEGVSKDRGTEQAPWKTEDLRHSLWFAGL